MDIKVDGLSMDVMRDRHCRRARKGRLHIVEAMYATIPAARADVKTTCAQNGETVYRQRNLLVPLSGRAVKLYRRFSVKQGLP